MFSFFKRFLPPRFTAGLTLVEMTVVVGIFVVLMAVLLSGLPSFRDKTSLDLVAEEVALVIRQAQVFGVATRGFQFDSSPQFPSHGIFFDSSADRRDNFVLFADEPLVDSPTGDGFYDSINNSRTCDDPQNRECREVYRLQGGVVIDDIVGCEAADEMSCFDNIYGGGVHIAFVRPAPDAIFSFDSPAVTATGRLVIRLRREGNDDIVRHVVVWNTGHIYACNPNNAPAGTC